MAIVSPARRAVVEPAEAQPAGSRWRPGGAVLLVAGALVAVELALAGRYGYHRDELYFLACARHLAWGYVDQPPLTPLLAWVALKAGGGALLGLRLEAALAGAGVIVGVAWLAAELGGGRRAQLLAALTASCATLVVLGAHMLTTAEYDQLFWVVLLALAARLLRTGRRRGWLAIGAVAGLGIENNYRVACLLAALLLALALAGPRRLLGGWWPWAGGAVALALVAPTLAWQALHGWPLLGWLSGLQQQNRGPGGPGGPAAFLAGQVLFLNPELAPVWLGGGWWLLASRAGRPWRALGVTWLVLLASFLAVGGRPYYIGPIYLALFAAAAVWAEGWLARLPWLRPGWVVAALLLPAVATSPFALPVLPQRQLAGSAVREVDPLVDMVGWPDLVATVTAVYRALPPEAQAGAVIYTRNYGEAAALQQLGKGLPPVVSGHDTYRLWGPGLADPGVVIAVGVPAAELGADFTVVRPVAVVRNRAGVPNLEEGGVVRLCSGLRAPWPVEWARAGHDGDAAAPART